MKKLFSIVIPVYKNELNLPVTIPYLLEQMPKILPDYDTELVLVNDGSPDRSWEIMQEFQKKYPDVIHIASFVHNFGQVMAVRCGISMARGEAIGLMAADMQDPVEMFAEMVAALDEGYEMACGVRTSRKEHGLGAAFSKITHKLINRFVTKEYPVGGFDFLVISRDLAERVYAIPERNGSFQLLLLWSSGSVKFIPYERRKRELGKSSWTFAKKVTYFLDTFVTNTYLPLRVMSVGGFTFAGFAFLGAIYIFVSTLIFGSRVLGWSTIVILVTFFSGLILAALGIVGEYLWRIFEAVKGRPLYIVKKEIDETKRDRQEK